MVTVKTFTSCKLYFNKPDYKILSGSHLSPNSFKADTSVSYTQKEEMELIYGNIRKADFYSHK